MFFSRLFKKRFSLSTFSEADLQILAACVTKDNPLVYTLEDIFGTQTLTKNSEFDFESLWKGVGDPLKDAPEISYRPTRDCDFLVSISGKSIFIDDRLESDPIVALVTQAHFASFAQIEHEFEINERSDPALADVLMISRGFGLAAVEARYGPTDSQWLTGARLEWNRWFASELGVLTKDRIAYLLALVSRRQEENPQEWKMLLVPSIIPALNVTERHFEQHPPILFDQKFHPQGDAVEDDISRMLNGDCLSQYGALMWLIHHDIQREDWARQATSFSESNDEDVVAMAVQALAAVAPNQSEAIEQIRKFLQHRSQLVVGCAYQSLLRLGDDPEYLDRVSGELRKRGIPFELEEE